MTSQLEKATGEYKDIEEEITRAVETRRRLEEQLTENESVHKEFLALKAHNAVYKLVGTVLIPQESEEAKMNVSKRLEYIKAEIQRAESRLGELKERNEKKRLEIVRLQGALQPQAVG